MMNSIPTRFSVYLILFVLFNSVTGKRHHGAKSDHSTENSQPLPRSQPSAEDDVDDSDEADQCFTDFDVQQNTIIRTYDSRVAGAEFLTSPNMKTAQDCMLACCETHRCNLAVFEDKNNSSCYLFDCGIPSKCLFTPHTSYVTMMRDMNLHEYHLDKLKAESKHETDLQKLSKMTTTTTTSTSTTTTTTTTPVPTTTITPTTTTAPTTTKTTVKVLLEDPHDKDECDKFQFHCETGHIHCIAIYDVCDGIKHCEDGSDEDGCPGNPDIGLGNTYSSYPVNNHYDAKNTYKDGYLFDLNKYPIDTGPRYDDSFFGGRKSPYNYGSYGNGDYGGGRYGNGKEPYIGKDTGSPDYRYGNGKEPYIGKDTGSPDYRYGDRAGQRYDISSQDGSYNNWDNKFYGREGIDVSGQPAPRWDVSREGESSVPAPQEPVMLNTHGGKKGPQLGPRPLAAPEPTMHSGHELAMGASQSHGQISPAQHYAAGQAADNDDSNGAPYGQNLQGTQDKLPPYQPQGVQRNDMYDQSIHDSNRGGNQLQPDRNRGAVLGNRGAVLGTLGQGYQQQPYQGDVQQEAARVPPREYAPANQPPPERTGADSGAIHQEGVAAAASDPASVTPGNASSGGAAAAAEKEPGKPAVVHLHMDVQEQQVQLEEEVFSPQAAENSGAVLALSLGLAVTALLLAFVGCRLRSFKRRARRRGPLNVHDPDYLINGMYL